MTHDWVTAAGQLGLVAVAIGAWLCGARLVRGPTLADRVVAADTLAYLLVAFMGLLALIGGHDAMLDVAMTLALVAFLATLAFARHLEARAGGKR